jgi:hypothetical protein
MSMKEKKCQFKYLFIMKVKTLLFLAVSFLSTNLLFAQHDETKESHETEAKNEIALFVGNTIIAHSGFNLPTIGVEYVREINHFIGVGVISEIELGSHVIQTDDTGDVVGDVRREGALLILPTVFFKVKKSLVIYAGYGVEFETNENLGLLKVGLKYKLILQNPRWMVFPDVSWDHTRLFDGFVYGVSFGYKF